MENKVERSVWSVAVMAVAVFLGLMLVSGVFVGSGKSTQSVQSATVAG